MSKIIDLEHRNQFRALLNPVRQEIVHILRLSGRPMSANAIAVRLNLSPTSAQGHLKKLVDIGLICTIEKKDAKGRKLVFYRLDDVDIRLNLGRKDIFQGEREALAANLVDGIFRQLMTSTQAHPEDQLHHYSRLFFGAVHLSAEKRTELMGIVERFLHEHGTITDKDVEHWEYVVMAYRSEDNF